jgi:hypothetical protein
MKLWVWCLPSKLEALSSNSNTINFLKNEIMLLIGKWMELELIMLSEISQAKKEIFHVLSHMQNVDLCFNLGDYLGVGANRKGEDGKKG